MYNRQQILEQLSLSGYYLDSFELRKLLSEEDISPCFENENKTIFYDEEAIEKIKAYFDEQKTSKINTIIENKLSEIDHGLFETLGQEESHDEESQNDQEPETEIKKEESTPSVYDNIIPKEVELEQTIDDLKSEVNELKSQKDELLSRNQNLKEYNKRLISQVDELSNLVQKLNESNNTLKEKQARIVRKLSAKKALKAEATTTQPTKEEMTPPAQPQKQATQTELPKVEEVVISEKDYFRPAKSIKMADTYSTVPLPVQTPKESLAKTNQSSPEQLQPPVAQPKQQSRLSSPVKGLFSGLFNKPQASTPSLNLKENLEGLLPPNVFNLLYSFSKIAEKNGYTIYLVGGVVRDAILMEPLVDIDIVVEGNAISFCEILEKQLSAKILKKQNDLVTATIFIDGVAFDFASTRIEYYPKAGQLPVVKQIGCSLEQDLLRRDFTVNAMAISLNGPSMFQLIDILNGKNDLSNKLIRVLHKNSFHEDPTRIIRALKFATRLRFTIEEQTFKLQQKYLTGKIHPQLSFERVKSELRQMFSSNLSLAYNKYLEFGLYKFVNDSVDLSISGLEIRNAIQNYGQEIKDTWLVYLGASVSCFSNWKVIEITDKLMLSNHEKAILVNAIIMIEKPNVGINENFEIYRFFQNKDVESILIYYLKTKDKNALHYLENLKDIKLEINGEDLINIGFIPSPKFSDIFLETLKAKLGKEIVTKEDEIEFVRSKFNHFM